MIRRAPPTTDSKYTMGLLTNLFITTHTGTHAWLLILLRESAVLACCHSQLYHHPLMKCHASQNEKNIPEQMPLKVCEHKVMIIRLATSSSRVEYNYSIITVIDCNFRQ